MTKRKFRPDTPLARLLVLAGLIATGACAPDEPSATIATAPEYFEIEEPIWFTSRHEVLHNNRYTGADNDSLQKDICSLRQAIRIEADELLRAEGTPENYIRLAYAQFTDARIVAESRTRDCDERNLAIPSDQREKYILEKLGEANVALILAEQLLQPSDTSLAKQVLDQRLLGLHEIARFDRRNSVGLSEVLFQHISVFGFKPVHIPVWRLYIDQSSSDQEAFDRIQMFLTVASYSKADRAILEAQSLLFSKLHSVGKNQQALADLRDNNLDIDQNARNLTVRLHESLDGVRRGNGNGSRSQLGLGFTRDIFAAVRGLRAYWELQNDQSMTHMTMDIMSILEATGVYFDADFIMYAEVFVIVMEGKFRGSDYYHRAIEIMGQNINLNGSRCSVVDEEVCVLESAADSFSSFSQPNISYFFWREALEWAIKSGHPASSLTHIQRQIRLVQRALGFATYSRGAAGTPLFDFASAPHEFVAFLRSPKAQDIAPGELLEVVLEAIAVIHKEIRPRDSWDYYRDGQESSGAEAALYLTADLVDAYLWFLEASGHALAELNEDGVDDLISQIEYMVESSGPTIIRGRYDRQRVIATAVKLLALHDRADEILSLPSGHSELSEKPLSMRKSYVLGEAVSGMDFLMRFAQFSGSQVGTAEFNLSLSTYILVLRACSDPCFEQLGASLVWPGETSEVGRRRNAKLMVESVKGEFDQVSDENSYYRHFSDLIVDLVVVGALDLALDFAIALSSEVSQNFEVAASTEHRYPLLVALNSAGQVACQQQEMKTCWMLASVAADLSSARLRDQWQSGVETAAGELAVMQQQSSVTAELLLLASGSLAASPFRAETVFQHLQVANMGRIALADAARATRQFSASPVLAEQMQRLRSGRQDLQLAKEGTLWHQFVGGKSSFHQLALKLETEIDQLSGEIGNAVGASTSTIEFTPVSIAEVERHLGPAEAYVTLFSGRSATGGVLVRNGHPPKVWRTRTTSNHIDGLVRSLRVGGNVVDGQLPRFPIDAAHELYEIIFGDVSDELEEVATIYITGNGPILSVPFPALVVGEKTQHPATASAFRGSDIPWLIGRTAVSMLPSANALLIERDGSLSSNASRVYAGIGNPILGPPSRGSRGYDFAAAFVSDTGLADIEKLREMPSLPETELEISRMAELFGAQENDLLLGTAATETNVRRMDLSQYRIISFATHGLVGGDLAGSTEPGLVLTPPNEATLLDDGLLTSSEIAKLELDADLVLLSACNTAASDGSAGAQALSGLAQAFVTAGARGLIVTHWSIPSEPAVELTTRMVELQRTGIAKNWAQAHQIASLEMIGSIGPSEYAHPANWAGFAVFGAYSN